MLGLHLYTWALLVFVAEILAAGVNLVFARELEPRRAGFGWPSWLELGLFGAVIVANALAVFALERLHWTFPTTRIATDCSIYCAAESSEEPQRANDRGSERRRLRVVLASTR